MLIFNMTQIKPVSYGSYQYPAWAITVGWIIGMASVLPIPLYMVMVILKSDGSLMQVKFDTMLLKHGNSIFFKFL